MDFSDLVLGPAMDAFCLAVPAPPPLSQPNGSPYAARGVWTITDVDIVTEDGGSLSNRTLKFGIRLAEFTVAPKQGDWISSIVANLPLSYWQGNFDPNTNKGFIV